MLLRITVTIPGQCRDPGPKDNTGDEETEGGFTREVCQWTAKFKSQVQAKSKKNTENKH